LSDDFPHSSRAGHYGLTFPKDLLTYIGVLATALIPGNEKYPSGGDAQVAAFIQDRASSTDMELLQKLSERWPTKSVNGAVEALRKIEQQDPMSFAYLREFIYHGYYSSHRVLAVMADRGYAYHGAPQPLGYKVPDVMSRPTKDRGTYIKTEEVSHVPN